MRMVVTGVLLRWLYVVYGSLFSAIIVVSMVMMWSFSSPSVVLSYLWLGLMCSLLFIELFLPVNSRLMLLIFGWYYGWMKSFIKWIVLLVRSDTA